MKKTSQQSTSSKNKKFAKPTPLSDIPCFQGIAGKSQQAGSAQQPVADLGELFNSIIGMKEIFSGGPLNQQQDNAPDCIDCEDCQDRLQQCRSAAFRVEVLVVLAGDLISQESNPDRISAVLAEIENQARDLQALCGTAY